MLFLIIYLQLFIAAVSASCNRSDLLTALENFFSTAFARNAGSKYGSLALSPEVRITQNNLPLKSIEDSAWGNSTSFHGKWRITAVDTETCNIAAYLLLNQKAPYGPQVPAIVGIRIRKEPTTDRLQEVEIMNLLDGGPGILRSMFKPDNNETYSNEAREFWASPQRGKLTRTELIAIANTYPSGIQAGDGKDIPVGSSCPRWENGVQTAGGSRPFKNTTQPRFCKDGLDEFKQPVEFRRWVADTETGVVLGLFYFSHRKTPLVDSFDKAWGNWLNEFFKIQDGKMVGVHAIMLFVRDKKDTSSGVTKSEWRPVWT
jgi:hypothetical protein